MMSDPSFPSFPSFSSFPDLDSGPIKASNSAAAESSRKEKKREDSSSKHRSRDKEEKEKKRDKERHKSRSGKGHRASKDEEAKVPTRDDEHPTPAPSINRFFYSDRKGDRMNIQYGGLHAGDVPKYYTVDGNRGVLGLPSSFIIYRRAGKGVEVGIGGHRKMSGLTDSGSRALLTKAPTRRLIPSADKFKYEEEDGFIRLPSRAGRKTEESYRSITRDNNHDSDSSSSKSDDASSDDEDSQPILTAHQETLRSLEQALTSDRSAIDKWLALLDQTLSSVPISSKNATQARSEITVSIITRALSANPNNSKSKYLKLRYLKAGEEIWHESKTRAEWEDAFKTGEIEILMEWLEWRIRKGNAGLEAIVNDAVRALDRLGVGVEVEVGKVRIFWRIAVAVKNAGYSERAMAMFQSEAELIFESPPSVSKLAFQAKLNELEDFWESEAPRIGEEGAQGWKSWYASKTNQQASKKPPLSFSVRDLDPYRQWASQETMLDCATSLPARSDSDTTDPYSTILFADIRSMMIEIRSARAKSFFCMAWLSFLGLHIPGLSLVTSSDSDWDDRWNMDYLTSPSHLNSIFPSDEKQNNLLNDSIAGVVIGKEREYASPFGPVQYWSRSVSGPLDLSSAEPGRLLKRGVFASKGISNVDVSVVRRIFTSLRMGQEDPEWDTLFLAFELAVNPKNATKVSKSLLSTNRESLMLWSAHAQLERLRGRLDDARKVYQTTLITSKPSNTQDGVSCLWWNWAEMEWLAGSDEQSLNVILKSVGMEGTSSGVALLRARRSLEDLAETSQAIRSKGREAWIKLRALLELLTGHQPSTALAIFDRYVSLESQGAHKESLTTSSLLLVYYYGVILRKPMPPSILRDRAHAAFEEYPSNSIILGMLLEAERGQGIWGRVRAMLGGNDGKVKDVARRIEEVWIAGWEKGRWLSEVERTRNGLAAAIEHERTRCSPVIWRIFIEFEIRVGELQRAKKLLFRAIGECPLVKGLYLLAFGPLRSVFGTHELNGLADTMVERGLRLHQGLDEVLEGMEAVDNGGEEEQEDSEDEIEHSARELRRLMPY